MKNDKIWIYRARAVEDVVMIVLIILLPLRFIEPLALDIIKRRQREDQRMEDET